MIYDDYKKKKASVDKKDWDNFVRPSKRLAVRITRRLKYWVSQKVRAVFATSYCKAKKIFFKRYIIYGRLKKN